MLSKTLGSYKNYVEVMKNVAEVKASAMDEINRTYLQTSKEWATKFENINKAYYELRTVTKENTIQEINENFNDVKAKIYEAIAIPAPADTIATIQLIEQRKASITEQEVRAILERYKKNYLAFKGLCDAAPSFATGRRKTEITSELTPSQLMFYEMGVLDVEALESNINDIYQYIMDTLLNETRVNNYNVRLILNGEWVARVSEEINKFLQVFGNNE